MNLIDDAWIPSKCRDGNRRWIAPWEIGVQSNPVVEIDALRPDFRGALYEFLIGLLQTTFAPARDGDWKRLWENPPTPEELKVAFAPFHDSFELDSADGPAFMQDFDLPEDAKSDDIRALLIDLAGTPGFFVKRDSIQGLCDRCTAAALYTLQSYAPSGGRGHRTGLRGGGPLTTLLTTGDADTALWPRLWLNVGTQRNRALVPNNISPSVFPWMGPTRVSPNNEPTIPSDVDPLYVFWAAPRRIRLSTSNPDGLCDLCGEHGRVWTSIRARHHGPNYSSTWSHPLSPYRHQEEKDGSTSLIAVKGKRGAFTYPAWLSLTIGKKEGQKTVEAAASVVREFNENRRRRIEDPERVRVRCFGYAMDNMKALCWYEHTWPIVHLPQELPASRRERFVLSVGDLVTAAREAVWIVRQQVKAAWFGDPKSAKGDMSFVDTSFYNETEGRFLAAAETLRKTIIEDESEDAVSPVYKEWYRTLRKHGTALFDRHALSTAADEGVDMARIAKAADGLSRLLATNKAMRKLKEEV